MDRKKFIKNLGLGVVATPIIGVTLACSSDVNEDNQPPTCTPSPSETAGPFPLKSPADFVRANIVGDRNGVPLVVNLTIQNTNDSCNALADAYVDIWQCDAKGNYSEYARQLDGNFTNKHFLRGRQTTNSEGKVSFISIYPGWYPGRSPHLHIEVLQQNGNSLLVTQIAFPENISNKVYSNSNYKGSFDTSNSQDGLFDDSLAGNIADKVAGNNTNGYTLNKIIKVAG